MRDSWTKICTLKALVSRNDAILQGVLDEVVGASGTVVKDKIIEILSVFRLVIDHQGIYDALFLRGCEIELLPVDTATNAAVEG